MNIEDLYTVEACDTGAEVRIRNQYGKYTDMYITVHGIDSKKWRYEERRMKQAGLAMSNPNDSDEEAVDKAYQLTAEGLANITIGWRGFKSNDKEIEFTKEKAIELYTCAPYVRLQVDQFFSNRANFTKG